MYDMYLLELFQNEETLQKQGIIGDRQASEYLKELGCNDPRVGKYNVLRLTAKDFGFERIFVFFDTENFRYRYDNKHDLGVD